MNWLKSIAVSAVLWGAVAAISAQEVTPLLGVPFGGPMKLTRCPFNTDQAKAPCWIGQPYVHKPTGSTSGSVYLPGADRRPEWAAYAMFEVTIDKAGKVQSMEVHTLRQGRQKIADSISLRFGSPYKNELKRPDVGWAHWKSAEGTAEMNCSDECWITFRTPTAQADLDAELAERAKKDAGRPKAP